MYLIHIFPFLNYTHNLYLIFFNLYLYPTHNWGRSLIFSISINITSFTQHALITYTILGLLLIHSSLILSNQGPSHIHLNNIITATSILISPLLFNAQHTYPNTSMQKYHKIVYYNTLSTPQTCL